MQTIKDRWAEDRQLLSEDNRPKRKPKVPNADGEPEQVLQSVPTQVFAVVLRQY